MKVLASTLLAAAVAAGFFGSPSTALAQQGVMAAHRYGGDLQILASDAKVAGAKQDEDESCPDCTSYGPGGGGSLTKGSLPPDGAAADAAQTATDEAAADEGESGDDATKAEGDKPEDQLAR